MEILNVPPDPSPSPSLPLTDPFPPLPPPQIPPVPAPFLSVPSLSNPEALATPSNPGPSSPAPHRPAPPPAPAPPPPQQTLTSPIRPKPPLLPPPIEGRRPPADRFARKVVRRGVPGPASELQGPHLQGFPRITTPCKALGPATEIPPVHQIWPSYASLLSPVVISPPPPTPPPPPPPHPTPPTSLGGW
ncbi:hypothetical protein AAC387_Pa02g3654 [Persea americana]